MIRTWTFYFTDMLANGKCEVTGKDGIIDLEACRCACMSPLMGINCDGSRKSQETMKQQLDELDEYQFRRIAEIQHE